MDSILILASTYKCCVLFFHLQLLEMKVEWTGKGLDSVCLKNIGFCKFIYVFIFFSMCNTWNCKSSWWVVAAWRAFLCGLWQLTCKCIFHLIFSISQDHSLWFNCDLWFHLCQQNRTKSFFVHFRAHQAIPQFPYHPGMAGMAGMASLFYPDALGECMR